MNEDTIISFRNLFLGFPLAYGTDEGGCRWADVDTMWHEHLLGEEMIGIYPMVYDPLFTRGGPDSWTESSENNRYYVEMDPNLWMCKWGSIDIDEGEGSHVLARNTQTILSALDIVSWVELSRSKGCHLWLFAEEWVRSSVMRRAMQAALQLAEVPYDAVYPKQDSLAGPPGNYMRLPYGGNRVAGKQEMLDEDGTIPSVDEFLQRAEESKVEVTALERAAALYKDPTPLVVDLPPKRDYNSEPLMTVDGSRLRGLPSEMFKNGPVPYYKGGHGAGKGRHGFLNRFARAMFETGYTLPDVVSWTKDLDSRLGAWYEDGPKFTGRQDCERQIARLVGDAERKASR